MCSIYGYEIGVGKVCNQLGYSRDAYYKMQSRQVGRERADDVILGLVHRERALQCMLSGKKILHLIKGELAAQGIKIGRDRFYDLLRSYGLLIERKRRSVSTTNSRHAWRRYKNLLTDRCISMPNEVWVCDITYVRTHQGFVYLCLIMDAYSRKIVGWSMHDSLEMEGCLNALKMALRALPKGGNLKGLIHHSDQGVQYCCKAYTRQLIKRGIQISMASVGNCYENAQAERLNGILKQEYGLGNCIGTKAQARKMAKQAVDLYNQRRPHLALQMACPDEVHEGRVSVNVRMSWAKNKAQKAA